MKKRLFSFLVAIITVFATVNVTPFASSANYTSSIGGFYYDEYYIPKYDGDIYETVNGNDPEFSLEEKVTTSYETYSELDSLGRCGEAQACLSTDTMPKENEQRGDISKITPTGWKQASYSIVSGSWLYNRCHLIGWQLSAENANEKNLITGTRSFNVDGMLIFEDEVASYIKETNNHVLYRVTPVFEGTNLLATGVIIEAESVENNEIEFCVFCYNVQNGLSIDYSNGNSCLKSGFAENIENCNVLLNSTNYTYTGSKIKPNITVKNGTTELVKNTDYTVSYSNNINVGTAKITVTGTGNYSGSLKKTFSIKQKSVSNLKYSIPNKAYTGKQIKPSITLKNGNKKLVKNTDYAVTSYGTNKNTGKGYVTVKGKGNYKGSKKLTFYIVPKKTTVSVKNVTANSVKLKWNNVTGKTGYAVAYKKSGASGYKSIYLSKNEKTITSLSSNTNYTVKVRAYKTIDGVKKYGEWSTAKTFKTTKGGSSSKNNSSKTVYISSSGKKYHFSKNCRGLSSAKKVTSVSLSKAKSQGYTVCGWEK